MKIADIYNTEQNNNNSIYLHKEGLFLRAYEVSAYLFCKNIKKYSVIKKHYKIINKDIVYIGFPSTVFEQLKFPQKHIFHNDLENYICVKEFNYKKIDFLKWKQKCISESDTVRKRHKVAT